MHTEYVVYAPLKELVLGKKNSSQIMAIVLALAFPCAELMSGSYQNKREFSMWRDGLKSLQTEFCCTCSVCNFAALLRFRVEIVSHFSASNCGPAVLQINSHLNSCIAGLLTCGLQTSTVVQSIYKITA